LILEDGVQPLPFDELHHEVVLAVLGLAVFIGFDDARVLELHRDLALGRFFERFEAGLEQGTFFGVEDLQANRFAGFAVAGHVEARHRAADRFAQ
jgi:hypothetical protein